MIEDVNMDNYGYLLFIKGLLCVISCVVCLIYSFERKI